MYKNNLLFIIYLFHFRKYLLFILKYYQTCSFFFFSKTHFKGVMVILHLNFEDSSYN